MIELSLKIVSSITGYGSDQMEIATKETNRRYC